MGFWNNIFGAESAPDPERGQTVSEEESKRCPSCGTTGAYDEKTLSSSGSKSRFERACRSCGSTWVITVEVTTTYY